LEDTITTTYYLCEEFLKATGHRDDPQVLLSTAEVMTIAVVACAFFGGNLEASRSFLDEHRSQIHTKGDLQESLQPPVACHRPLPVANAFRYVG
jgi:hypothetical protein